MFYDNLKAICDEKNIKITPLVLECGGTKGVIGGWRKGAKPNSDIVMKLAVKLNITTDYLLFGEEKLNTEDDKIKYALFDGLEGVTDEMYDEVKQYAQMVKMRENAKNSNK